MEYEQARNSPQHVGENEQSLSIDLTHVNKNENQQYVVQ